MTMPEYVADTTPFTELHEGLARIHAAQTILLYCARELQSAAESVAAESIAATNYFAAYADAMDALDTAAHMARCAIDTDGFGPRDAGMDSHPATAAAIAIIGIESPAAYVNWHTGSPWRVLMESAAESARAIAATAMDECAMMANDYPRMDDARIPDIWRILGHAYAIRVSADCIANAITERDPYA